MNKVAAFFAGSIIILSFTALFCVSVYYAFQLPENGGTLSKGNFGVGALAFFYVGIAFGGFIDDLRKEEKPLSERMIFITGACIALFVPLLGGIFIWFVTRSFFGAVGESLMLLGGIVGTAVLAGLLAHISFQAPSASVVRGRTLTQFDKVAERITQHRSDGSETFYWGGFDVPASLAAQHFCVLGSTGSGKSVTLRLLMQSVLPQVGRRPGLRAAIYDAKRDVYGTLVGMNVPANRIQLLNPFDARSVAWNMALDIRTPGTADQVARTLVPREEGPNRFFADAAADLLAGVIKAFILRGQTDQPAPWTFRDVLIALQNQKRLERILKLHPVTQPLVDEYFQEERTFQAIRSTLRSHMAGYETVAALWSHSENSISLHDWLNEDWVLVIGNDDSLRAPIDAINRVVFQRLSELLLTESVASESTRTWIMLDELKEAGRLDGLPRLLTKGREFGVRVAVGFQDIDGLVSVYGPQIANEILAMCGNKAILRLDSHTSAAWAAEAIGEAELKEVSRSTSYSSHGTSESFSEHIVTRKAVLSSELLALPHVNGGQFMGYYIMPSVGVYPATIPIGDNLRPQNVGVNFERRPVEHQYLSPWNAEDVARLKLPDDLLEDAPAQRSESTKDAAEDLSLFRRMTRDNVP